MFCAVVSVPCSLVGHLLGKGLSLGSLVCDVFLCYCHFPIWCPGPRVEFDCNVSLLPYFDLPRSFKLKSSLDLLS